MQSAVRHWVSHSAASIGFGIGLTAMLNADIGLSPYDGFNAAAASQIGVPIFVVLVVTSTVFLALGWALGRRPGPGTVTNYFLIAATIAVTQPFLPEPSGPAAYAQATIGAGLMAIAAGIVIASAHLGTGPYSQTVLGLSDKTRRPIWQVQLCCDLIILACALAIGASVGFGTILPLMAFPILLPVGTKIGGLCVRDRRSPVPAQHMVY